MSSTRIGRSYPSPHTKTDRSIIAAIVSEFTNRTRKGIRDWRAALQAADNYITPRWSPLQDLYEYLLPDAHLGSQMDLRKGTIMSTRFYIQDAAGKENKEKTKMLQCNWFFRLMWDLLDTKFFGYTVIQVTDIANGQYDLIPRRNFVPQRGIVLFQTFEDEGVLITDPVYAGSIIYMRSQYKFGIMNDLVPSLIWKRNAQQSWAEFADRFGMPLITATTNKTNKEDLDRVEDMLRQLAEAARAVLPEGTSMKVEQSISKGDPYNVYLKQMEYADDQISKRLVGGTMVSDNGSSRSQSEVHERNMNNIIGGMDMRDLEFVVNQQLMPMLVAAGLGFAQGDTFVFDRSQKLPLTDLWDVLNGMITAGYEIDQQWLSDKFNVPITGKGEKQPSVNFNPPAAAPAAVAGKNIYMPAYISACGHNHVSMAGKGSLSDRLQALQQRILQKVYEKADVKSDAMQKGIEVGRQYQEGLFQGWGQRRVDIAYNATDHRALAMMEMNLFTFSSLREQSSIFALNQLLIDKDGKKLREFTDFEKATEPYLNTLNHRNLQTEYNFAIATGQNASSYHQFLTEADTVTRYLQYMTVGDDRVRPAHQALQGKIFSIDDPEARLLWPPNDYGCRCEFVQYLGRPKPESVTSGKDGIALIDWNEKQKAMFAVNRGDIGQVFLKNQQYMSDAGLSADVKGMDYKDYGLKSWADIRSSYKPIQLDNTITRENVGELFKPEKGQTYMGFEDYLNRKLILPRKTFDEHTADRYTTPEENRHQLFAKVKEVLSAPDEVYLFNYRKGIYQYRYVKFYGDKVLVVPASLGNNNLEIATWFEMKVKDEAVRNGLLIYNK